MRKRAAIISITLLAIAGGIYLTFFKSNSAFAEWFDQNWYYRQAITITVTSSGSDVANLDTWFSMNTSALVTASKLQSSCQDLRFTNANGKLLPYYIDSGCNTTTTKIWIKADLITKNSTTYTVYAYYGNPSAVAGSDSNKFNLYNGLVGYWNMNEASWTNNCSTATVKDLSVNGNNGKSCPNAVGPTGGAAGKYGNAGSFNAGNSNYIDAGDINAAEGINAIAVSAWINPTASGNYRTIIAKSYSTGTWEMRMTRDSEGPNIFFGVTNASNSYVSSSTAIANGVWTHVVGVYDGANVSIYINGVLKVSHAQTGTIASNSTSVMIGQNTNNGEYFSGSIDEARIYSRALSANEISQLYSDGTSSILTAVQGQSAPTVSFATEEKSPAPVAYWKFDEGQGTSTSDSTPNNNAGTLVNSPAWTTSDQCISGKCLYFDGVNNNAYVNLGSNPVMNAGTGSWTLEYWIKTYTWPSTYAFVFDQSRNPNWLNTKFDSGDGKMYFELKDTTTGQYANGATAPLTIGQWYHYALVIDQSAKRAKNYLNGALDTTSGGGNVDITNINNLSTSGPFNIGSISGTSRWKGLIDEVKIYPYARTAAQIKADYASRGSTSGTSVSVGSSTPYMSNGLVGYWKMDEATGAGSTLADSSGNGNNGTAVLWGGGNTATDSAHVAGKFGNAFSFDGGDDYLNAGNGASLNMRTTFTLGAWVKSTNNTSPQYQTIINHGGQGANGEYWLYLTNGKVSLEVGDGTNHSFNENLSSAIGTTGWNHIVVTFNNGSVQAYVNGSLVGSQSLSVLDTLGGTQTLRIGSYPGTYFFNGSVDEVRIYNRALSSKEVADLYNWAPGPVGWWKMDDNVSGNNQTLVDSSTYGNNGTASWGANASGMNCKIIGKYGGGCLFDGIDDYVDAGTNIAVGGGMTIEGWINMSLSTRQYVFAKSGSFNVTINPSSNLAEILFSQNGHDIGGNWWTATDSYLTFAFSSSLLGSWHYLTITVGNGLLTGYLDGQYKSSVAWAGNSYNNGGHTYFSDGTTYYPLSGYLDDVRVYNYARTQKQIAEDMNGGHPSVGSPVGSYAAWWKFDEGHDATVNDQSGNANTGTITGATWTNNGKFGKALAFDGTTKYVNVGNGTSLGLTDELTYATWVKFSSFSDPNPAMISHYWRPVIWRYNVNGGVFQFTDDEGGGNTWNAVGKTVIQLNQWYFVVGTFSKSEGLMKIYVNGNLEGQTVKTASINLSGGQPVTIGCTSVGCTMDRVNGIVDEVKIYPFALTQADILTEYNRGKALAMGSFSDTSGLTGGSIASNSASALYCIPGDTTSCNSPVAEWKFDENVSGNAQAVYDTSGNGNNGTTNWGGNGSGMNCKVLGKYATACQFDGVDDSIDAGSNLTLAPPYTVEGWVKIPLNPGSNNRYLIDFGGSAGSLPAFSPNFWTSNKPLIYLDSNNYKYGTSNLADNNWHHIAFMVTGTGINDIDNAKIYVDGKEEAYNSTTKTAVPNSPTGKAHLGSGVFNGTMDEVKVFNYSRSAAQIAWDYNKGKPVGWWKFDECQGTTAYDSSGNAYAGTITIGGGSPQTQAGTCADGLASSAWYNGRVGKFNSAMSFDGTDDYVTLPNNVDTALRNPVTTISMWTNIKSFGGGGNAYAELYSATNTSRTGIMWRTSQIGVDANADFYNYYVPVSLSFNTWYHIAVVIDRNINKAKVYVNGVYKGQTNAWGAYTPGSSNTVQIGRNALTGNSADYLNGMIDEVKLYNYELTLQQIQLEYNQGSAVRFGPTTGRP